ncbi:hypothetical protein NOVO_01065 [Rickettsiales bacterium Ac37b]|nr:hypothetical protein NOVO_01065 [Rickettsiales bacterium Ac37b]
MTDSTANNDNFNNTEANISAEKNNVLKSKTIQAINKILHLKMVLGNLNTLTNSMTKSENIDYNIFKDLNDFSSHELNKFNSISLTMTSLESIKLLENIITNILPIFATHVIPHAEENFQSIMLSAISIKTIFADFINNILDKAQPNEIASLENDIEKIEDVFSDVKNKILELKSQPLEESTLMVVKTFLTAIEENNKDTTENPSPEPTSTETLSVIDTAPEAEQSDTITPQDPMQFTGHVEIKITPPPMPTAKIEITAPPMPEPTPVEIQAPVEATTAETPAPVEITPETAQVEEHTLHVTEQNITPSVPMTGESSNQHIEF